ncbi:MAG: hypothetical protein RLZZ383_563 [Pseudomonadota bacterium]|jgi:hypothetical protein
MIPDPSPAAIAAARHAYEAARWTAAAPLALAAALWAALGLHLSGYSAVAAACALALPSLALGLQVYGRSWSRGVLPGLYAGLVPFLLPSLVHAQGCGPGGCGERCLAACVLGGVVSGAWLGLRIQPERDGVGALLGAAAIATSGGALGCACIGATGVGTMALASVAAWGLGRVTVARRYA